MCEKCKLLQKQIYSKIVFYTTPKRVRLWLIWGVAPTFVAILLLIFGDMWVGYTFIQATSRHILDFCLTIFTITVSVFSAAMDEERQIEQSKRFSSAKSSAVLGIFCAFIYAFLYYRKLVIEKGMDDYTPQPLLIFAHIAFIIIAWLVIRAGIMLEKATADESVQPK